MDHQEQKRGLPCQRPAQSVQQSKRQGIAEDRWKRPHTRRVLTLIHWFGVVRPNDPSSVTRRRGRLDGNLDGCGGFYAAHGETALAETLLRRCVEGNVEVGKRRGQNQSNSSE